MSSKTEAASTEATATAGVVRADSKKVHDPVFDVSQQEINTDADTTSRQSSIIHPTTGGTGTYAAPINGSASTTFQWEETSALPTRWGSTCLAISFRFYGADATTACDATRFAPPWDLWAHLIRGIRLSLNSGSKNIYEKTGHDYRLGLMARMMRYCSENAGANLDSVFFTPTSGSETYSGISAAADATWGAGTEQKRRADRWIGTNSHLKTVTKLIPFSILFGMPDAVFRNLSGVNLTIDWLTKSDGHWTWADGNHRAGLLEQSTLHANAAVAPNPLDGATAQKVVITNCYIVRDRYNIDGQLSTKRASDKVVGAVDRIAFIDTDVMTRHYTPGSVITINGVENLDAVAILQPAIVHTLGGDSHYENGVAHANAAVYGCPNQMLLGSTAVCSTNDTVPSSADQVRNANGMQPGFATVWVTYGAINYPESPLVMTETNALDATMLYTEYLKACGKLGRRDIAPFVNMSTFKSVCPFIMLRPFGDNAPHPSGQKQDLLIRLTGGRESDIYIVIFKLVAFRLTPDGATRELTF